MIYVCSDLHGYPIEKFKDFLKSTGFSKDDFLYILGDVIDRGPDGVKYLKWLLSMPNAQLILGNHESMMLACRFLFEEITRESVNSLTGTKLNTYSVWVANSGGVTLNALSGMRDKEIQYILEYLEDAPLYETLSVNGRDFLLTHSGLRNFRQDKKLSEYKADDFVWNRPTIDTSYFDGITCIFGHTPTVFYGDEHRGKAVKTDTWIDIDAGAALGLNPMILRLDDMKEFYME